MVVSLVTILRFSPSSSRPLVKQPGVVLPLFVRGELDQFAIRNGRPISWLCAIEHLCGLRQLGSVQVADSLGNLSKGPALVVEAGQFVGLFKSKPNGIQDTLRGHPQFVDEYPSSRSSHVPLAIVIEITKNP
jgi:hypothetical protein